MPISCEVTLRGMRFHARVGVLAHERELPQPIELDVSAWIAPSSFAAMSQEPLDYRALHAIVSSVMAEEPIDYIESIAAEVAQRALALGAVARVRVTVRKPHVALGSALDGAEVTVDAQRDG